MNSVVEICPDLCNPGLGCIACVPGTATCEGNISNVCRDDRSGTDPQFCDPVQRVCCEADGKCAGSCAPQTLKNSYIGCEYFPTVSGNLVADGAIAAGESRTLTLNQGDVAQLYNWDGDLTGTRVTANKPVQVLGGHLCTFIPDEVWACDHLEESMFPVQTLSNRYVVTAPAVPALPNGKERMVRIVAIEGGTTVSYDPAQTAATTLANAGDMIEIPRT